jgi:hypothetical protein
MEDSEDSKTVSKASGMEKTKKVHFCQKAVVGARLKIARHGECLGLFFGRSRVFAARMPMSDELGRLCSLSVVESRNSLGRLRKWGVGSFS